MKQKNRVIFYLHNGVHLLDLAGAVQAFQEAGDFGQPYELIFVSSTQGPTSSAGLPSRAAIAATLSSGPGS